MYLLYMDESGQHGGDHFVLGGVAVFERRTYWLAKELDQVQDEFLPDVDDPVELHASEIRGGRSEPWDSLEQARRYELLDTVYESIADSSAILFGIAVDRNWLDDDEDEYLYAFESLVKRFDDFLARRYREEDDRQRGLVIIASSEFRRRIEQLALTIQDEGTRWGDLYNLADIPLFTPAENTRLLQAADFVANAVYGRYEGGYTRQLDRIVGSFFSEEGVFTGLAHFAGEVQDCPCPACMSRRQ